MFLGKEEIMKMKLLKFGLIVSSALGVLVIANTAHTETRTFNNPMVEGYGLDYCREWAANCGMPAAQAYCESQGYDLAIDFRIVEDNQKTRVIETGQVCDADYCDRISQVTCQK